MYYVKFWNGLTNNKFLHFITELASNELTWENSPFQVMQPRTKAKSASSTDSQPQSTWVSPNVILYFVISVLLGLYSSYIVNPDLFRSYANEYHVIKYLEQFFNVVEAYSPFHEFIIDSESGNNIATSALRNKIFTKEELMEYDGRIATKGPYLAIMGEGNPKTFNWIHAFWWEWDSPTFLISMSHKFSSDVDINFPSHVPTSLPRLKSWKYTRNCL